MKSSSIRRRLLGAFIVTTLTTLLLTCAALMSYEWFTYRRSAAREVTTLARTIAANSSALIVYDDQKVAREVLSALKSAPEVVAACLYNKDGTFYSAYPAGTPPRAFPPMPGPDGPRFSGLDLTIFEPVMQAGGRVGTLFIREDLNALYQKFAFYALVVLLVLLGAVGFTVLMSSLFQQRIAQPILDLAGLARRISEQKDFAVRAPVGAPAEELALLNRAFNEMLDQIHARDLSLQQYAATLEAKVAERTLSLEETTRQLYDFCYSIAHDLKAPIRAQAAYGRILMDDFGQQLGTEGADFASRIVEAAERQSRLVSDLLAHVSLSRSDLPIMPVDLAQTVQQVRSDLRVEIERQEAQVDISGVHGSVLANPASLHLVVLNLMSNALKFVPRGRAPQVRAWAEPRNGVVRLWVEDNGLGIAPKYRDRLFAMFQRLHTREEYPGTGIGLALVKRAAERMGGNVGLESEIDKGSRFWIELKSSVAET